MIARVRQAARFGDTLRPALDARRQPKQMRAPCRISAACHTLLKQAMEDLHPGAPVHDRISKGARTIAELAEAENIEEDHLLEALQYRSLDRSVGT